MDSLILSAIIGAVLIECVITYRRSRRFRSAVRRFVARFE